MSVTLENIPVSFLIDTSSNVTIVRKDLLDQLSPRISQSVKPTKTKLLTVTGEITPFHGKTELVINIGSQTIPQKVLVVEIENDGILGMDFLTANRCEIMLTRKLMKLNGETIRCFANSHEAQPKCCRIALSKHVEIPPGSDMIVEDYAHGIIDKDSTGLLEVYLKFLQNKGLSVAKALVNPVSGTVPVRIANPYNQSRILHKDTVVANYEPLEPELLLSVSSAKTFASDAEKPLQDNLAEHLEGLFQRSYEHITPDQQSHLNRLLVKYQNTFSKSPYDLGYTSLVEYTIDLIPGTRPIKQRPYRLPLAKRQAVESEIQAMADRNLIEPTNSPWSSPVIIVPKKNGEIRFCIDNRKLKEVTIKFSQTLPNITEFLDALGGSKWFSCLDLKSGFHQISVAEKDRSKTAFCIPGSGLWQFKVMPFGATNSPAVFERLMERLFSQLAYTILLIYIDDVIVFSKTFEVHLKNLEEVLRRLKEANLKLNVEKCVFFQVQVTFLGHLISHQGVSMDPQKIKAIEEWPRPRNVTGLRSFVGLVSYLRRFIPKFGMICKPLHELTETGRSFELNDQTETVFLTLKEALISAPVLAFPRENGGMFILDADCSNVALGSVLSQEQDGEERVIAYFSKCLAQRERRYCTTRKELLAIVSSIKHFHHYLYGRSFMVRSDHGSLTWLMNFTTTAVEGQIARWLEYLASYDFKVLFRSGASHRNADSMSRRPCIPENCEYCNRIDKRYTYEDPELATRAAGESLESIAKGESTEKDGLSRQFTSNLDELVSSDGQRGNSKSSVKVHLHEPSYDESIPDRSNKGVIRKYTLPGFTESQKSLHINHGKVTVSGRYFRVRFNRKQPRLTRTCWHGHSCYF